MEKIKGKEKIQPINLRSQVMCLRPGGNDTALVLSPIENKLTKKSINDFLMKVYPNIEQVGFVSIEEEIKLNMAGGEFCGNAAGSAAWLALEGKPGTINLQVSGVTNPLKAGVTDTGERFSQMPVYAETSKVIKDQESDTGWIVEMQGITHYVDFDYSQIKDMTEEEIKKFSLTRLKEKGLDNFPASGVIFVEEFEKEKTKITPVVYVKEIDTLFIETACGSGTCALGQVMAVKKNASIVKIPVIQPSGETIKISVVLEENEFKYAQIEGKISLLSQALIKTDKENSFYVIEKVNTNMLKDPTFRIQLISLYKKVFSEPPYSELFSDEDVEEYFQEYIENGTILIARNDQGIIGFSVVLPLKSSSDKKDIPEQFRFQENCQYIAELGVAKKFREKGIGQSLIEELLMTIDKNTEVLLRTQEKNEEAIKLYSKLGFIPIEGMIKKVIRQRTQDKELEDKRIFMIKNL